MVKRRNITATVRTPDGVVEGGKWVEKEPKTYQIIGRAQYLSKSFVRDQEGDTVEIKAKFFTDREPIEGAGFLEINGKRYRIVDWFPNQTYKVILLTS